MSSDFAILWCVSDFPSSLKFANIPLCSWPCFTLAFLCWCRLGLLLPFGYWEWMWVCRYLSEVLISVLPIVFLGMKLYPMGNLTLHSFAVSLNFFTEAAPVTSLPVVSCTIFLCWHCLFCTELCSFGAVRVFFIWLAMLLAFIIAFLCFFLRG